MIEDRATEGAGMRARFRNQVRDDVKRVALRQLAEGGPQSISVNAIAKELGVSGPALYRYFRNRDDLITALVIDAYGDLAAAIEAAIERRPATQRLTALARGYRAWAVEQPHRYRLLFAEPTPGYDAHQEQLVDAAQRLMVTLAGVLAETGASAAPPPPRMARQLKAWARKRGIEADPALAHRAITAWSRLHGIVSLEIEGNFASMGLDAALLFEAEVAALAE